MGVDSDGNGVSGDGNGVSGGGDGRVVLVILVVVANGSGGVDC